MLIFHIIINLIINDLYFIMLIILEINNYVIFKIFHVLNHLPILFNLIIYYVIILDVPLIYLLTNHLLNDYILLLPLIMDLIIMNNFLMNS